MTLSVAMHSSERMTWNTPQVVLDALAPLGRIALDPCSNPTSIVDAWHSLSLESGNDGLAAAWRPLQLDAIEHGARSLIYVNPPYGRELPRWIAKCDSEAEKGCEIAVLVPARTDTRWWRVIVDGADAIALWGGRLRFLGAPAGAPFPTAIAYWGSRRGLFIDSLRAHSTMVVAGRCCR